VLARIANPVSKRRSASLLEDDLRGLKEFEHKSRRLVVVITDLIPVQLQRELNR
jgi:hypothetical protein